jgi:hypothetical protein
MCHEMHARTQSYVCVVGAGHEQRELLEGFIPSCGDEHSRPFVKNAKDLAPRWYSQEMEPHRSSGILLHENRFSIKYTIEPKIAYVALHLILLGRITSSLTAWTVCTNYLPSHTCRGSDLKSHSEC